MQLRLPLRKRQHPTSTLAATHVGIAYKLAAKARRKFPAHVEFDDIVGYAMIGLCEAASKFDSSRKLKFSTYAYTIVWGRIIDGVKRMHRKDSQTELLGDRDLDVESTATDELMDMEPALHKALEELPKDQRLALTDRKALSCGQTMKHKLRTAALNTLRQQLVA